MAKQTCDLIIVGGRSAQAAAEHHFQYEWIASSVTLALSALTTITVLENEGYALMPL